MKSAIDQQKKYKENIKIQKESDKYQSALLLKLGSLYAAKNWTMQLHLGPVRDTNSKLLNQIGKDAGVDSIGDLNQAKPLAKFLDRNVN